MNYREMNLTIPHVLFQPRFEPWYDWQQQFGRLPERFHGQSLVEIVDALRVSMRYVHYYTGMPDPVVRTFAPQVKIRHYSTAKKQTVVYETPHGELSESSLFTDDGVWRMVEFPVKRPDDLVKLRWLFRHTTFSFSKMISDWCRAQRPALPADE